MIISIPSQRLTSGALSIKNKIEVSLSLPNKTRTTLLYIDHKTVKNPSVGRTHPGHMEWAGREEVEYYLVFSQISAISFATRVSPALSSDERGERFHLC